MNRKSIRNFCFFFGIIVFLIIVIYSIYHTNDLWNNEAKALQYDSFIQYYFSRAKGELLIAFCAGVIPSIMGVVFTKR